MGNYKQVMTEPNCIATTLNALKNDGKEIAYVIPCHEYHGTLIVIVYKETNNDRRYPF